MGEAYGGKVELVAKAYYKGLSESVLKNFNGTAFIAGLLQCNNFSSLGKQQISMGRVGRNTLHATLSVTISLHLGTVSDFVDCSGAELGSCP